MQDSAEVFGFPLQVHREPAGLLHFCCAGLGRQCQDSLTAIGLASQRCLMDRKKHGTHSKWCKDRFNVFLLVHQIREFFQIKWSLFLFIFVMRREKKTDMNCGLNDGTYYFTAVTLKATLWKFLTSGDTMEQCLDEQVSTGSFDANSSKIPNFFIAFHFFIFHFQLISWIFSKKKSIKNLYWFMGLCTIPPLLLWWCNINVILQVSWLFRTNFNMIQ